MDYKKMSFEELIENMSNPLESRSFLDAILRRKARGEKNNIRTLEIEGFKKPDDSDGPFSYDDSFRFESEMLHFIIKEYYKLATTDSSKLNPNMINPKVLEEQNLLKIKELADAPIEVIEVLRFDLSEGGYLRDPFKKDERERAVYDKIKRKYGIDEDLTFLLSAIYHNMARLDEHMGKGGYGNIFCNDDKPYSMRIYLNTPEGKDTLEFTKFYAEECIWRGIPYDCKIAFNSNSNDRTILYATEEDICRRIVILEDFAQRFPEKVNKFGTPILNCSRINDSYYGISHAGITSKNGICAGTYNDYFDGLCETAFVLMKARIMMQRVFFDKKSFSREEWDFISDVAILKNFAAISNNPYGRQRVNALAYFPSFDYKDGFEEGEVGTPDPTGNVFRSEGISWKDINKKLNEILDKKLEIKELIKEKKKTGEIDVSSEFGTAIRLLANLAQGRKLSAKTKVTVSRHMEEFLSEETKNL